MARVNQQRTFRCLSQFSLQNSRIPTLGVVETYFHLMWMSSYIVSFGVITYLVTSSTCMEVRRFRLNFHNCYRSQKVQSYLLQLPLEVKNLVRSYSDEQGFCSYFKIVECGPNYKLLNINPFWKFLRVERSSWCFYDGRPSYPRTTFLCWTTFLYWDNLLGLG